VVAYEEEEGGARMVLREGKVILLGLGLGLGYLLLRRPRPKVEAPPPPPSPPEIPEIPKPPVEKIEDVIEEVRKTMERLEEEYREWLEESKKYQEERREEEEKAEKAVHEVIAELMKEPYKASIEQLEELARKELEEVEESLREYGGFLIIFREEPPEDRKLMFMNMLNTINWNTRGMCVYGGGFRWYDALDAYAWDVKATWSPSETWKEECKRLIRGAIVSAFTGYIREVREY
jgi:hypothetical protein